MEYEHEHICFCWWLIPLSMVQVCHTLGTLYKQHDGTNMMVSITAVSESSSCSLLFELLSSLAQLVFLYTMTQCRLSLSRFGRSIIALARWSCRCPGLMTHIIGWGHRA